MDEANVFFSGIIRAADERLTTGVERAAGECRLAALGCRSSAALVIVVVVGGAALSRRALHARAARGARRGERTQRQTRAAGRSAHRRSRAGERGDPALRLYRDARSSRTAGQHHGLHRETRGQREEPAALIDRSGPSSAGRSGRARRAPPPRNLPEAIGFIRSSTEKMDGLINAILKLSREGRRALQAGSGRHREMVEAARPRSSTSLREAGGKIDVDLDVPRIDSDRLSLEQIFGNLLDNAVKYRASDAAAPHRGARPARPGDRIRIEIADNGRGIARDAIASASSSCSAASGTQDQPGEGIGLAYVRTVVRNLGGDISVTSELGRGTNFRLTVPRALTTTETIAA